MTHATCHVECDNILFTKVANLLEFYFVLVLSSAQVERFSVSRMQDFVYLRSFGKIQDSCAPFVSVS